MAKSTVPRGVGVTVVGEKLGSFKIQSTLGVGAMGVVYRAVHEPTNRPAAVKVINKEIAQKGKAYERFQREAEILQQFRHPNIVRFLAHGRFQGTSYIAMEFIQGKTLEEVLEARGALPWREVVELAAQMCDALQYAHDHGVVHRDLKPSNLMITDDGRVKLTDFGIAKDLDKTALTATGRTLGTAAYMAPEQIKGTPALSHKTDLYALGCVVYQMLTGEPPYSGGSHMVLMHNHLNTPVPRPSAKVAEIPKAVDSLIVKLMAKEPQDRPYDAAKVGLDFRSILEKDRKGEDVAMVWPTDGATNPGATSPRTDAARKPRKKTRSAARTDDGLGEGRWRRRLETLGLVVALAALGSFIAYWVWPESQEYLYRHAERLMASTNARDWREARDTYLDVLDRRYPDNPYKKTTRGWRDKILLEENRGRADMLQSPVASKLTRPNDRIELRWVEYFTVAKARQDHGDDLGAAAAWEELGRSYRPDDEAERAWHLMARKKADDLKKAVADRHEVVLRQVARAKHAELQGNREEAAALWKEIIEQYGRYTDVADLLPDPAPAHDTPAAGESPSKPAPPGTSRNPATGPSPSGSAGSSPTESPRGP